MILALILALLQPISTVHAAAAPPVTLTIVGEGWYQPDPLCTAQLGCILPLHPPAQDTYGAGIMHIAVTAGMEKARAYITPAALPPGPAPTKAVLTIPLDTVTLTDGSLTPQNAHVKVCTTEETIPAVAGSYEVPPVPNCATSIDMTYVAGSAPGTLPVKEPVLQADITPLLETIEGGGVSLALLPDIKTPTDTWHAAFSAHDRKASATNVQAVPGPPTIALTILAAMPSTAPLPHHTTTPTKAPTPATRSTQAPVPVDTGGGGGGFVAPPGDAVPSNAPVTGPAPQVAGQPTDVAPQITPQSQTTITHGFDYPGVILVPLLLLIGVTAVGRQLIRSMDPEDP